jgi:hypothetical protein
VLLDDPMFFTTLTLLLSLGSDFAGDWQKLSRAQPEGYLCGRATQIVVDGRLDEASWGKASWTRDFQDIEGSAKPKPRFRTRAKMLWDDQYFYVAAELEEPHVWGTITNHDAVIFQDPDFEVFIDPDGDRHNYYEFEMNALNTGWDLLLKKAYIDGGPALNEWEIPGLKTGVHVNGTLNKADKDRSWTVEIAFPWKVLREFSKQKAPPAEGDTWRVDFSRVEWQIEIKDGKYSKVPGTKEDNWVWSPTGIIDMHRPENWGYVKFAGAGAQGVFQARRDPDADSLLALYYAQKDFYEKNKRWASSLRELGNEAKLTGVSFQTGTNGYRAKLGDASITEDGLLKTRQ